MEDELKLSAMARLRFQIARRVQFLYVHGGGSTGPCSSHNQCICMFAPPSPPSLPAPPQLPPSPPSPPAPPCSPAAPCKTSQDVETCKVDCYDAFDECKKGGSKNKPCRKKEKTCKKQCKKKFPSPQ